MRKYDAAHKLFKASGLDGTCLLSPVRFREGALVTIMTVDSKRRVTTIARTATGATRQVIAGMRAMLAEAGLNPKARKK